MEIEKKLKNLPTESGVYLFRDNKKRILYIGKAANLKHRLGSYFHKNTPQRIKNLTKNVKDLKTQETASEIEALILESQLIKKYQPRYNVLLRDDKNFFYVGITKQEFPRIFITHQPFTQNSKFQISNFKKTEYIGPFTEGRALKNTLRIIRHYFPYCTCKKPHHRTCINYQIRKCLGICCMINKEGIPHVKGDYIKNIQTIKKILKGQNKQLVRDLRRRLERFIKKEEFEKAAKTHDMLMGIKSVIAHKLTQKTHLPKIKNKEKENIELLKKFMKMKTRLNRIEAYDISNIKGRAATGSMIVFENGKINKSQYRKFKIKTKARPDDTAMLKEVLERRFKNKDWPSPDLIFIDGGRGQINAAIEILKKAKIKIPVFSLGKGKGEVFSSIQKNSIKLDKLKVDLKLFILNLKDEAHRFAIKYHRQLRSKEIKDG
jgi:excinuclease ABC subunit C